jgi:hypothetical protein
VVAEAIAARFAVSTTTPIARTSTITPRLPFPAPFGQLESRPHHQMPTACPRSVASSRLSFGLPHF